MIFQQTGHLLPSAFIVLTIICVLLVFDGYLQFFTGTNILNYEKTGIRISSFFGDELVLGSYVVRFFPIYLGLYFLTIKKRFLPLYKKIFFFIFFLLITMLIIISGERTAFGLLILSILLMFFFLYGLKKTKTFILTCFILTSLIFTNIYQNNFERLVTETKDQIINEDKIFFFGQRRHEYAIVSINIFKENLFFGAGPRTYRISSKDKRFKISELSWNTHPHNIYFQLLAETGILGTLMIFFAFSYFFTILFRKFSKKLDDVNLSNSYSNIEVCIVVAIIINIFPLVPSGNFFNNWMSVIFYYPVALFFAYANRLKH